MNALMGRPPAQPIIAFESPPHSSNAILQSPPQAEALLVGTLPAVTSKSIMMHLAGEHRAAQRRAQRRAYVLEALSHPEPIHPPAAAPTPTTPSANAPPMDAAAPGETLHLDNYINS